MEAIGNFLQHLGFIILPYSFWAFCLTRWLEHFWGWKTSMSVGGKAIWYFLAGLLTFQGDNINLVVVVGYICFIEFWDNFLKYRQGCLDRKGKYRFSSNL